MKHHFVFNKPAIHFILLVGIFTFVFLGAEYLFVNMISLSVTEGKTVIAQNYALGASAVGFFLYPAMERWVGRRYKSALTFILALGAIICTFIVQQHISYAATMTAGMVLFLLLGVFGSAVHYLASVTIDGDNALARLAGIAYALGILLQYANNNLVNLEVAEAAFLSVFLAALSLLVIRTRQAGQSRIEMTETAALASKSETDISLTRKKRTAGIMLALLVVLMACVFSTLDNAVTLRHAGRDGYRAVAPPVAGAQRPRRRLCLRYPKAEVYGAYHVLRDDDVGSVHCGTEPGRSVPDWTGGLLPVLGFFRCLFHSGLYGAFPAYAPAVAVGGHGPRHE